MRAVLTYHSIDGSGSPVSIDPADFRRHVRWLATRAVRTVPLAEILDVPDDEDAVAVTFDDGFANVATEAWPLLEDAGIPATVFVVADRVGGTNDWSHGGHRGIPRLPLADWETLGRLAERGAAIASHGRTHVRLDGLDADRLEEEVAGSAAAIERAIGARPDAFAYPYGSADRAAVARVEATYARAVTTDLRPVAAGDLPHRIPRLDAFYFREPGTLERWGSPAQRGRLWVRRRARRARRWVAGSAGEGAPGPGDGPAGPGDASGATPPAASPGPSPPSSRPAGAPPVSVDLVVPVLNEAHVLEWSVGRIRDFLSRWDGVWDWRVTIVDNGSSDGTDAVGSDLAGRFEEVTFHRLDRRGRGRALRWAWRRSDADVVAYTDVDLSTDLEALPRLVAAIVEEGYDVATGSRLLRESHIVRSLGREVISRGYNLLLKAALRTSFSDAQCGFKAVSRRVTEEIVPDVEDESWFFDSELLVLAERRGYRIKDVPITWIEDDDSRVKVVKTGWEDVKGIARLRRAFWREARAARRRRAGREPAEG